MRTLGRNKGERVSASETHKEEAIAAHSKPSDARVAARGQRARCGCEDEDAGMAIRIAVWMVTREVLRFSAGQAHANERAATTPKRAHRTGGSAGGIGTRTRWVLADWLRWCASANKIVVRAR
jgi:hypothetical protein